MFVRYKPEQYLYMPHYLNRIHNIFEHIKKQINFLSILIIIFTMFSDIINDYCKFTPS